MEVNCLDGNMGENFICLIERRLDNVVYCMGFVIIRSFVR